MEYTSADVVDVYSRQLAILQLEPHEPAVGVNPLDSAEAYGVPQLARYHVDAVEPKLRCLNEASCLDAFKFGVSVLVDCSPAASEPSSHEITYLDAFLEYGLCLGNKSP